MVRVLSCTVVGHHWWHIEAEGFSSTVASSTPVSAQPDIRKWPAREHKGRISVAALITTDVASHAVMTMTVGIDYTKMSMVELYLCQSTIAKDIQARDKFSQLQLDDTRKQKEDLAAQMEAAEQRKKDTERKRITLVRVLDEACRSLPDFDMQQLEEPEQRMVRLKDYAQQSRSEMEKLKVEHETQLAELQLCIHPESPPTVKEQRRADIQASTAKLSDIVGST